MNVSLFENSVSVSWTSTQPSTYASPNSDVTAISDSPSSTSPTSVNVLNLTDTQTEILFYGYTVLIPVICSFGIVGNVVNLSVLLQSPIRNRTPYIYLTALAMADLLTVLLEMINGIGQSLCLDCTGWKIFDSYVHLPVGGMTSTMSVGTVSVYTAERFIYIKAPFMARRYCKAPVARRAVLGVLIFSILFNIPYFFVFRVDRVAGQMVYTAFSATTFYVTLNWVRLLLLGLLPAVLLSFVNLALLVTLHRAHKRALMRPRHYLHEEYRLHQRCRVTVCLCAIIVFFIAGELPTDLTSRTSALYLLYGGDEQSLYTWQYQVIKLVTTVLMCMNYSCNFLWYCTLDTKFVQIFRRTYCILWHSNDTIVHTIGI